MTELTGQLERITYTSEETGYTIAKLKVQGQWDLVTIVGNILSPTPGEILTLKGEWVRHAKYGEQFKVQSYQTAVPATVYGIRKYLGSGMITPVDVTAGHRAGAGLVGVDVDGSHVVGRWAASEGLIALHQVPTQIGSPTGPVGCRE